MVEAVGARSPAAAVPTPLAPATAAAPASAPAQAPAASAPASAPAAGGLARAMAASAPVDTDRVATIKKAIAEGRFPILPATIADRMIAFKLHWNPQGGPDDQA